MASIPPQALQHLKFDNSLGALLIGALFSATLFGLTTLQTYLYYVNYQKDRTAFKVIVGTLWVLDLVHTVFISHSTYYFLVTQYGNPRALLDGEWSLIMEVAITLAVTVLVQCFFAHRVYKFTENNYWLAGTIVLLAFAHAGVGVVATVKLFQIKLFSRLSEVLGVMSATLIIMAANDVFITAVLCWYLRKAQSTFSETQSAIRLLIVYTIETGLVTSIFVTIDAICILTMPHNWIFIGITFCVSKLYANSLLTILNSRNSLKKDGNTIRLTGASIRHSNALTSLRMQELSGVSKEMSPLSPSPSKMESHFSVGARMTEHTGYAV